MAAQDTIERLWKALESDRLDQLDDVIAADAVVVNGGVRIEGLEGVRQMLSGYATAFDMQHLITQVFEDPADAAHVAVQLRVTGTHTGPMVTPMGEFAATGGRFELDSVDVVTVGDDGRITSWSSFYDPTPLYAAIGLVPA